MALQQPVVSLLKLEYPPLVSNFPMYSDVQWDSKDAYSAFANTIRQPPPQLRIEPLDGSAAELVLKRLGETGGMEEVMKIATGIVADRPISDEDAQKMRDTATVYQKRFGVSPPKMVASIRGWQFDWSRADFTPRADTRQVILDFAAGSIDAAKK